MRWLAAAPAAVALSLPFFSLPGPFPALSRWPHARSSGPPSAPAPRSSPRISESAGRSAVPDTLDPEAPLPRWTYPVGERLEYGVRFGRLQVGRATLAVEAVDTLEGHPAYRVSFELAGGPFFYRIDDRSVSWVATDPVRSLRFEQRLREGGYRRHRRYRLDQEAGTYTREDWVEELGAYREHEEERDRPMPAAALDEIAFLYVARGLPLEPGRVYRFDRYFEPDGNPVVIEVLRRETVRVPAGRFRCVVLRPVIRAGGMFGEEGEAELYVSDDERRLIVRLRTRMKAGTLDLYLRRFEPQGWTVGTTFR